MTFNKAREECKWKQWKAAEEKKMRELGVSEEIIRQLYRQDWEDFKRERSYREHQFPNSDVVEMQMGTVNSPEENTINTVQALLQSIENQELFRLLLSVDKKTLQIVLFRMMDVPTEEIAREMGLTTNAIYLRINRIKEKMKKIYKSEKENG